MTIFTARRFILKFLCLNIFFKTVIIITSVYLYWLLPLYFRYILLSGWSIDKLLMPCSFTTDFLPEFGCYFREICELILRKFPVGYLVVGVITTEFEHIPFGCPQWTIFYFQLKHMVEFICEIRADWPILFSFRFIVFNWNNTSPF